MTDGMGEENNTAGSSRSGTQGGRRLLLVKKVDKGRVALKSELVQKKEGNW